jgi:hypothetical protein
VAAAFDSLAIPGTFLSLVPLFVTGIMEYQPGKNSLLEILSNEELLTVAFTLSGAAAVDVLIESRENALKFLLGVVTFLMTLVTMLGYILFKAHLTHLTHDTVVTAVQVLYLTTALLAFTCELSSQA